MKIGFGPSRVQAEWRTVVVMGGLRLMMVFIGALPLMMGDDRLSVADALRALIGRSDDPLAEVFVHDVRLPRILAAVGIGAGLGCRAPFFRPCRRTRSATLTFIGFTVGAATSAVLQIIMVQASPDQISFGVFVGGCSPRQGCTRWRSATGCSAVGWC